jgi:hypothetical protein
MMRLIAAAADCMTQLLHYMCEENKRPLKVAEKKRQESDLSPGERPSIIITISH